MSIQVANVLPMDTPQRRNCKASSAAMARFETRIMPALISTEYVTAARNKSTTFTKAPLTSTTSPPPMATREQCQQVFNGTRVNALRLGMKTHQASPAEIASHAAPSPLLHPENMRLRDAP